MARVPSYLRKRYDDDRGGLRWYVRVPIPTAARRHFLTKKGKEKDFIECALHTSDRRLAEDRAREKVVELKRLFERYRQGPITAAELKDARENELRRSFEQLAANMVESLDRLPQYAEEIVQDASNPIMAGLDGNRLLGGKITRDYAEELLRALGAEITDESLDTLTREILKAQGAAVVMLQRGITPPAMPGHRVRRHGSAVAISEAGKQWLAKGKWIQQTKLQHANTLRLFVDFAKDAPLDAVTGADAEQFRETIAKLSPKYGQHKGSNKKPLAQLLKEFPGQLTNRTLKRHTSALHLLFDWCRSPKVKLLPEGHANPFSGMQQREAESRSARKLDGKNPTGFLPYSDEELRTLFSRDGKLEAQKKFSVEPKRHSTQTALLWIGLVSLYGGLRQNEICGLLVGDVREEDGIPFFAIEEHEEHEGHRVKNDNAVRRVPIHSRLIELGFLRYVEHVRGQGHAYLFPGLKAGGPDRKRNPYFSKAWTAYARLRGVKRAQTSFHSLRNNFVAALEKVRPSVPESEVAQLVGHTREGFTFRTYSKEGLPLQVLRDVVEKVAYPEVKL